MEGPPPLAEQLYHLLLSLQGVPDVLDEVEAGEIKCLGKVQLHASMLSMEGRRTFFT